MIRAALFHRYGPPEVLAVEDVSAPAMEELRQVRVRVYAAAVNPKDTMIRRGRFRVVTGKRFPQRTGFDFAGEVLDSSASPSQSLKPGDRVFGMLNGMEGGACAEEVIASTDQLAAMPSGLSFEEAAALPLVSLTALQALRDRGRLQAGQHVCINGASGGVGSMAVQIARILGAEVTAVASTGNHDLLRDLGAGHCVDYREADVTAGDPRFHVFFDVFGNRPFRRVKPVLHPRGVWVSTVIRRHVLQSALLSSFLPGKKARMVIVKAKRKDLELIRSWVDEGRLRPVIHSVFPLDQIQEAHRQQETKHTVGKIVIRVKTEPRTTL